MNIDETLIYNQVDKTQQLEIEDQEKKQFQEEIMNLNNRKTKIINAKSLEFILGLSQENHQQINLLKFVENFKFNCNPQDQPNLVRVQDRKVEDLFLYSFINKQIDKLVKDSFDSIKPINEDFKQLKKLQNNPDINYWDKIKNIALNMRLNNLIVGYNDYVTDQQNLEEVKYRIFDFLLKKDNKETFQRYWVNLL